MKVEQATALRSPKLEVSATNIGGKGNSAGSRSCKLELSPKRKRYADDEDLLLTSKRPFLEKDYHLRKMKEELQDAKKYAADGNRALMEYCLRDAEEHGRGAGALHLFSREKGSVEASMGSEKDYHLRKMKKELQDAKKYAADGNRALMEYCLRDAKEHEQKAAAADDCLDVQSVIKAVLARDKLPDHGGKLCFGDCDALDGLELMDCELPLRCPLSLRRLETPVRSPSCRHARCVELSCLASLAKRPGWVVCPLCPQLGDSDMIDVMDFRVDGFMARILRSVPMSCDSVSVKVDGSFEAVSHPERGGEMVCLEDKEGGADSIDSQPVAPIRNSSPGRPKNARRAATKRVRAAKGRQ